jgi:UDP-glucose 4-epimerase
LLDNFNDYYSPIIKNHNVAFLKARHSARILDSSFIIIKGSINDKELLKMIFNKYKITHVAHLAVSVFVFILRTENKFLLS